MSCAVVVGTGAGASAAPCASSEEPRPSSGVASLETLRSAPDARGVGRRTSTALNRGKDIYIA